MRTPVSFLAVLIVVLVGMVVQADKLQAKASNPAFQALATALPADGTVINGKTLEVLADVTNAGITPDDLKDLSFAYLLSGTVNVPVGNSWVVKVKQLTQVVIFARPTVPITGKVKLVVTLGDELLIRTYTAR